MTSELIMLDKCCGDLCIMICLYVGHYVDIIGG
ncbi:hypothetical protein Leryth_011661 [Lithospermum erythrorhizon]|nr:hypothetical protein Leryth_011661 [Lithospermum erythrorhizon]